MLEEAQIISLPGSACAAIALRLPLSVSGQNSGFRCLCLSFDAMSASVEVVVWSVRIRVIGNRCGLPLGASAPLQARKRRRLLFCLPPGLTALQDLYFSLAGLLARLLQPAQAHSRVPRLRMTQRLVV